MKTVTKLAAVVLFALSAAAPALANEEAQTLAERNTYLYTADARPIAAHMQDAQAQRGTEAFAQAPQAPNAGISNHGDFDNY